MLHLTGRGRDSDAQRHPYLAALRQLLLELLPRPSVASAQLPTAATPAKGASLAHVHYARPLCIAAAAGCSNPHTNLMSASFHRPGCTASSLPPPALGAAVGASPFFRTPGAAGKRQADGATHGTTFYSVLLEFWITDGDEPVPAAAGAAAASAAAGAGSASMW